MVLDIICVLSVAWMTYRILRSQLNHWMHGALAALSLASGLFVLQVVFPDLRYMPYLLIVPINLGVAYMFARGLLPNREPILLELVRLMARHPADDPKFIRFMTGQCLLWSVVALATAMLAVGCLLYASTHPELATMLTWFLIAQIAWFAVSHHYAGIRYGRPETWWDTLCALARPDVRSQLVL